ncbi:MAG: LicD family protein, partial [Clostridia bacterium]|nr:LicD family protein [Clostridia bacterium]
IKNLDLDDYFIIIAIKDTLGEYLNNDIQDLLNKLGLNKTLIKKYQCGYIAVINNGQVVYEFLANNKIGVKCNFEIDSYNLDIHSLPFTAGNLANITIGTAQCAVNARGLNIVVFDKQNQYVIDSVCFDTHVNTYLATRKDCSAFESRVFKYKVNMTLSSQTELDLQNSLNGLKNTIDVNAVHSDIKYWQLYKNGNETELEARKRFFVGMDYVNPEIKIIQDCISVLFYYFDKICKENGLKYFMVGGSLIGAVRHAGKCVPWDDDIDVYMPRDDINKLLQIMESNDEFAANVYFGTMGQAYIRYLRFMFKGVNVPCFVDIFYMDYVENSSDITWNKHNELRREMIVQTASLEAKLASDNRLKRSVEIAKLIDNQIKKEQGILNPFGKGTSLIYGLDQNTFWCKNVYDYDDIFPTVTVPFVYGTCEIPAKVDMMLQRMYGDIYTLPNRMTGAHPSLKLTDEQKIETVRITTFYVNKILNQ